MNPVVTDVDLGGLRKVLVGKVGLAPLLDQTGRCLGENFEVPISVDGGAAAGSGVVHVLISEILRVGGTSPGIEEPVRSDVAHDGQVEPAACLDVGHVVVWVGCSSADTGTGRYCCLCRCGR